MKLTLGTTTVLIKLQEDYGWYGGSAVFGMRSWVEELFFYLLAKGLRQSLRCSFPI